jgi:hypothetical protein
VLYAKVYAQQLMPVSIQTVSVKHRSSESPWDKIQDYAEQAADRLKKKFDNKVPHFLYVVAEGFDSKRKLEERENSLNILMKVLKQKLNGATILGISSCHGAVCNDAWADSAASRKAFTDAKSFLSLWGLYDDGGTFLVAAKAFERPLEQEQQDEPTSPSKRRQTITVVATKRECESQAYSATKDVLEGKKSLGPPRLAIVATCPGAEEAVLEGLHQALTEVYEKDYGKDAINNVALFGGTPAADDIGDPPGWWMFGSQAFPHPPYGVCIALLWPTCNVRADFHHAFHESDDYCIVHRTGQAVIPDAPLKVHIEGSRPLLAGSTSSNEEDSVKTSSESPASREIITVMDEQGGVVPAAVWYDQRTSGVITKQVVTVMEDSIGQKLFNIPALYVLFANIALAVCTAVLQLANVLDLSTKVEGSHFQCIAFKIAASSLAMITVANGFTVFKVYYGRWDNPGFQAWREHSNLIFAGVTFVGLLNTTIMKLVGSYVQVPFSKHRFPGFHDRDRERRLLDIVNVVAVIIRDVPQIVGLYMQKLGGLDQHWVYLPALVLSSLNLLFKAVIFTAKLCSRADGAENRVLRGQLHRSGLALQVLPETAPLPLGRVDSETGDPRFTLLHVGFVTPEGGLKVMASVKEGDKLVKMASSRRSMAQLRAYGLPAEMGAQQELYAVQGNNVHGCLMNVCGGMMLRLLDPARMGETETKVWADDLVQEMQGSLGRQGGFLCFFPFGEQGRPRASAGGAAPPFRHSNIMYSLVIFCE